MCSTRCRRLPRWRPRRGALTVVDAVTSLGAMPLKTDAWGIDVCYSCSQKGLGAPSGLAPLSFSARALAKKVPSRSFYLDLALLEDYWVRRKYHHTISAPLIYAVREALTIVEEEGLEQRWARHERNHRALAAGLEALGLSLLPPAGERLWTLNAVRVPEGVDEAAVRRRLLDEFSIEIGAGLGPLAGRIWRVGLMGAGSTLANVLLFLTALERVLAAAGYRAPSASRRGDMPQRPRQHAVGASVMRRRRRTRMRTAGRVLAALLAAGFACAAYIYLTLPDVRVLRTQNPPTTAFIELRTRQAIDKGEPPRRVQRWVNYSRISPNLKRAVIVTEDSAFWEHGGVDFQQMKESMEVNLERMEFARGASTITQQLAKNLYLSPSKNPIRKAREILIARRLEAELSKQRILELYLNLIEWGNGIYGAEAAARTYFGKSAAELGPQESALLAGAIASPTGVRSWQAQRAAAPATGDDHAPDGRGDAAAGRRRAADAGPATGNGRDSRPVAAGRRTDRASRRSRASIEAAGPWRQLYSKAAGYASR